MWDVKVEEAEEEEGTGRVLSELCGM